MFGARRARARGAYPPPGTVGCGGEVRAAEGVVSCAPCTHVSARVERARRALAVRVCARACTGLSL